MKPAFDKALETVETMASTARRRLRCCAFCGRERRHGVFLERWKGALAGGGGGDSESLGFEGVGLGLFGDGEGGIP